MIPSLQRRKPSPCLFHPSVPDPRTKGAHELGPEGRRLLSAACCKSKMPLRFWAFLMLICFVVVVVVVVV